MTSHQPIRRVMHDASDTFRHGAGIGHRPTSKPRPGMENETLQRPVLFLSSNPPDRSEAIGVVDSLGIETCLATSSRVSCKWCICNLITGVSPAEKGPLARIHIVIVGIERTSTGIPGLHQSLSREQTGGRRDPIFGGVCPAVRLVRSTKP
ncbi:hypothetical protein LZ32DRAFT_308571 [Colletotrichum eremochloae]|nr:hypothetical protein LZ32DRAFT_308571 [Colletotrichum eremochloae]